MAAANGYANDGTATTVTVNVPPLAGPFAGQAGYAEVLVRANLQASFGAAFTRQDLAISARAVARGRYQKIGLMALAAAGDAAFLASGNVNLTVVNAPVTVNSRDGQALVVSGNATVTATSFEVAGGYASAGTLNGPVHTGVRPTADPLRHLPTPNPAAYPLRASGPTLVSGGVAVLQPGVYRGGIMINGRAVVTLQPGVYVLDGGGFAVSGQAAVTGLGVLLFNTAVTVPGSAGPVAISGQGSVTLTPPTGGAYAAISIFQDRNLTLPVTVSGNGGLQVQGVVYAPAAAVALSGNGVLNTVGGGVIGNTVSAGGNGVMRIDMGAGPPPAPQYGLVE
jgi:hypothetical protein